MDANHLLFYTRHEILFRGQKSIYIYIYIFSLGKYLRVTMSKLISTAELYVLIKTLFEFNKFNENAGSDSVCIRKHKLELCNIYSYINL